MFVLPASDIFLLEVHCLSRGPGRIGPLIYCLVMVLFSWPVLFYKMPPWTRDRVCSSFLKEGIFRIDLQKIVKKGSKFGPLGQKKTTIFGPFFANFAVFWTYRFSSEWIFLIVLIQYFWSYLEVIWKNCEKGSKFGPPGSKNGHFLPLFVHFCSFKFFQCINFCDLLIWFFLGIFRNDLQKIVKRRVKIRPSRTKKQPFFAIFAVFWA